MLARTGAFDEAIGRKVRADRSLVAAIGELAGGAGMMFVHEQKRWASITFQGTRHRMTWAFEGAEDVERGELLIAALPDHEFSLRGQFVADAAITTVDHRLDPPRLVVGMELLLLEEA